MAVKIIISLTLQPRERSLIGLLKPCVIGPIAFKPPKYCIALYTILPALISGTIKMLACPLSSLFGAYLALTSGTSAQSSCTSPSAIIFGLFCLKSSYALLTLSMLSPFALPFVE